MMDYWTVIQPTPATVGYLSYKGTVVAELYLNGSMSFIEDDDYE